MNMKIIISESQLDNFFSKLLKVPVNDNLINRIKNKFGEDLDSIARLILVAVQENKAEKVSVEKDSVILLESKNFYINKLPITIIKAFSVLSNSIKHPYEYFLKIPILGMEGQISKSLGNKIYSSLVVK